MKQKAEKQEKNKDGIMIITGRRKEKKEDKGRGGRGNKQSKTKSKIR